MKMSICTDVQGRVTGICPDDLTGGLGWVWIETGLTPATNLADERGIALYKMLDGAVMARTVEEIEADAPTPMAPAPTPEERLGALETETAAQGVTLDEVVTILEAIV